MERPWELVSLSHQLQQATPQACGWLQLLLLDALKWQATAQTDQLGMTDAVALIKRLSTLPTSHLLACHGTLLEHRITSYNVCYTKLLRVNNRSSGICLPF